MLAELHSTLIQTLNETDQYTAYAKACLHFGLFGQYITLCETHENVVLTCCYLTLS